MLKLIALIFVWPRNWELRRHAPEENRKERVSSSWEKCVPVVGVDPGRQGKLVLPGQLPREMSHLQTSHCVLFNRGSQSLCSPEKAEFSYPRLSFMLGPLWGPKKDCLENPFYRDTRFLHSSKQKGFLLRSGTELYTSRKKRRGLEWNPGKCEEMTSVPVLVGIGWTVYEL